MLGRREFLKTAGAAAVTWLSDPLSGQVISENDNALHFASDSMELQLSPLAPELTSFNIDGLAKGRRGTNIIAAGEGEGRYLASTSTRGGSQRVEYRARDAGGDFRPLWTFEFSGSRIVLVSEWSANFEPAPVVFHFDLNRVHSTVLGVYEKGNLLATPALMHFPGQGSVRISANVPDIGLTYESSRSEQSAMLSLPGATFHHKQVVYTLDVAAIHPELPGIAGDSRFDAFRRNWLNSLQLNPSLRALANNTASDTCAFCYYEYGDIAALTPALAGGLKATDILRQTLERMLDGGNAYGMPSLSYPAATSDTYPSLVIAAANYVRAEHNPQWLAANYDGIRGWTEAMLATDTDEDGLIKYCVSGNSGSWLKGDPKTRPSNWWDTIGFGHEDAYANALAYRALHEMAMMASKLRKIDDVRRYTNAADKLRSVFYDRFYDPETGILGGWRSADGKLHDYYFLWVNGIAIHYGLVPKAQANAIVDRLLNKMRQVGFNQFHLGLPGNLVTVPLKDYVHSTPDARYGGGVRPDNSDGFQNYENGGATGSFAFFFLAALYDLGRKDEADQILFPMLEEYGRCGFEGRDASGRSYDWRRWDGTPTGYEGLLVDNYYALLAVPLRQSEGNWSSGLRPGQALT